MIKSGRRIYFILNRRFTKYKLAWLTVPFNLMFLLRLVDFLVRMWRLNAFWKVIAPVPVILKRFLALEFVLTFGILHAVLNATLLAVLHRQNTYGAVWAITGLIITPCRAF